ncbi:hypothetical protein LCGC14_0663960 [marine sediment metagenome]|uniref:Leucine-rich repeat domain-containing protein n=1 Tax=marine sediment metagenome TaxID=412755 RepID=A0A0F9RCY6_9ZZZZ|nr:leucine-rich repeat domain-containing protein [bacterium]
MKAGDPIAKRVFKEEIVIRFLSGFMPVMEFLLEQGFLNYLEKGELEVLLDQLDFSTVFSQKGFMKSRFFDMVIKYIRKNTRFLNDIFKQCLQNKLTSVKELINFLETRNPSLLSKSIKAIVKEYDSGLLCNDSMEAVEALLSSHLFPHLNIKDRMALLSDPESILHQYYVKAGGGVYPLIDGREIRIEKSEDLDLYHFRYIKNVDKIKKLVINNNKLTNIHAFTHLKYLEELSLQNNQITTIKGIKKLINLRRLELQDNKITDISELVSLKRLKHLNLENNEIKSIKKLGEIKGLRHINLVSNKIDKLEDFSRLKKLRLLNLSNNNIAALDCSKIPSSVYTDILL